MTSDVQVRWATTDDVDSVARIHVDAWRAAYAGLLPQSVLDGLSVERRAAGWQTWLELSNANLPTEGSDGGPSHRLLVAVREGDVIAWAAFGASRDGDESWGELAGLYADPLQWSTGAGHALIVRVEAELAARGFSRAHLWVLGGNDRAIRFYDRHGWVADGAAKTDPRAGLENIVELRHARTLSA